KPQDDQRQPEQNAPILPRLEPMPRVEFTRAEWAKSAEALDQNNCGLLGKVVQRIIGKGSLLLVRDLDPFAHLMAKPLPDALRLERFCFRPQFAAGFRRQERVEQQRRA